MRIKPVSAAPATARSTEITSEADIQTDLSTKFVDVSGLGRVHEGFFEGEDVVHADVSIAR